MHKSVWIVGVWSLFLLLTSLPVQAQTRSITECVVVWTNSATNLPYVNVNLSDTPSGPPPLPEQVTIIANGVRLIALQVMTDPFGGFTIKLDPATSPGAAARANISIPVQFNAGAPAVLMGQCSILSPQERQRAV